MADFDWANEGGLAAFGAGIKGFAQGMMDSEDRKMKRIEMDAKVEAQKADKERQHFMDGLTVRDKGFKVPESGKMYSTPANSLEYDPEYLKLQEQKANADPYGLKGLQVQNAKMDINKKNVEAQQLAKGTKLPPDKVLSVQQGAQIPTILGDVEATLNNSKDLFGPAQGRLGSANPYDEKSQTINAQFNTASQSFGRYMEGGVLRKEDEAKYRKMFPQLTDTSEVAANKLALVRKMLIDKQNADVAALKEQGYDTSGFKFLTPVEGPGILNKKGKLSPGLLQAPGQAPPADDNAAKRKRLAELKAKAAQ